MPPIEKAPRSHYARLGNVDEICDLFDRLAESEFKVAMDVTFSRRADGYESWLYVFQHAGDDAVAALDSMDGEPIDVTNHYEIGHAPTRIARILDRIFR